MHFCQNDITLSLCGTLHKLKKQQTSIRIIVSHDFSFRHAGGASRLSPPGPRPPAAPLQPTAVPPRQPALLPLQLPVLLHPLTVLLRLVLSALPRSVPVQPSLPGAPL